MPPRYTYWTILLDGQPTAFRARTQEELLPTLRQLRSSNPGATMKWFAHGQLWESPEEAQRARMRLPPAGQGRGAEWRPGGQHRDPRARFKRGTPRAASSRTPRAAGEGPRDAAPRKRLPRAGARSSVPGKKR